MSNTRDFKSPGVFAADAVTTIPPTPTLGVAYRDPTTTIQQAEDGWPYGTKVDSDTFNQIMFQLSSMLDMMDRRGLLGWTSSVDYLAGALALGSDGVLYRCRATNGPSSGLSDPAAAGAAWERFGGVAASAAEVAVGTDANKFVSPAALIAGLLGAASLAGSGVARIPVNIGSGRVFLVVMWGGGTGSNGAAVSFPEAFPTACFRVIGSDANGREVFGTQGKNNAGFTLRTSAGGALVFDYIAIGI